MAKKKIVYSEPASFFPKEIRKKCGIGEFEKPEKTEKQSKKTTAKK